MFRLSNFAKFGRLAPLERQLFLRAVLLLPVIGIGLRLLGLRRLQALLVSSSAARGHELTPDEAAKKARQTARMVAAAARQGPYRASCLPISLALRRLLQRQGIQTDMCVGVRKSSDGKLEAHAWVEHAGQALIDGPEVHERFAAFDQHIHLGEGVSG